MSIRLINDVFQIDFMSSGEKFVLIALADNASDEGHCWPSQETIAYKTSLGVRNVRTHIHSLTAKGYLRAEASRGPGQSTRYWLDADRIRREARESESAREAIPVKSAGILIPVKSAGLDRSNQPVNTGQISRLTIIEPSVQPSVSVSAEAAPETGASAVPGGTPESPPVTQPSLFKEGSGAEHRGVQAPPNPHPPTPRPLSLVREKNHNLDPESKPARKTPHRGNVLEDDAEFLFEIRQQYNWPGFDVSVAKLLAEKFYWMASKNPEKQKQVVHTWLTRGYGYHLEAQKGSGYRGVSYGQQQPSAPASRLPLA